MFKVYLISCCHWYFQTQVQEKENKRNYRAPEQGDLFRLIEGNKVKVADWALCTPSVTCRYKALILQGLYETIIVLLLLVLLLLLLLLLIVLLLLITVKINKDLFNNPAKVYPPPHYSLYLRREKNH